MSEDENIVDQQAFLALHIHDEKVVHRERVVINFDRAGYASVLAACSRPVQTRLPMLLAARELRNDPEGTSFCKNSHEIGWKVYLTKQ